MKKLLLVLFIVLMPISSLPALSIAPDDKEAVLQNHPFYDPTSTGGVCTGGSFTVTGGSNLEIVWNYFLSKNFTPEVTAGIIGNLMVESCGTLDPAIREGCEIMSGPNDATGVSVGLDGRGIAQWSYNERWQNLLNYADALNREPILGREGLLLQLDFIMFEMSGQPAAPGMTGGTGKSGMADDLMMAITSTGEQAVEEAAVIFARYFERNQLSIDFDKDLIGYEEAFSYRINPALDVYNDLVGSVSTGIVCGPGGIGFVPVEGDTTNIPCQGNVLGDDEVVGYKDGVAYNIRICQIAMPDGSAGPWVNSQISGAYSQMATSAAASGISVDGGGYRTMEAQKSARINNCPSITSMNDPDMFKDVFCDPPTAIPGHSNHQMGFAVDMNAIPVSCPVEVVISGKDFCQNPSNATWQWLTAHASSYGLYQLRTETWHWSIDGT